MSCPELVDLCCIPLEPVLQHLPARSVFALLVCNWELRSAVSGERGLLTVPNLTEGLVKNPQTLERLNPRAVLSVHVTEKEVVRLIRRESLQPRPSAACREGEGETEIGSGNKQEGVQEDTGTASRGGQKDSSSVGQSRNGTDDLLRSFCLETCSIRTLSLNGPVSSLIWSSLLSASSSSVCSLSLTRASFLQDPETLLKVCEIIPQLSSLEEFSISETCISTMTAIPLVASLASAPSLRQLVLCGTAIRDAALILAAGSVLSDQRQRSSPTSGVRKLVLDNNELQFSLALDCASTRWVGETALSFQSGSVERQGRADREGGSRMASSSTSDGASQSGSNSSLQNLMGKFLRETAGVGRETLMAKAMADALLHGTGRSIQPPPAPGVPWEDAGAPLDDAGAPDERRGPTERPGSRGDRSRGRGRRGRGENGRRGQRRGRGPSGGRHGMGGRRGGGPGDHVEEEEGQENIGLSFFQSVSSIVSPGPLWLLQFPSSLRELSVRRNRLGDAGVSRLVEALERNSVTRCPQKEGGGGRDCVCSGVQSGLAEEHEGGMRLETLLLRLNGIREKGAASLASYLSSSPGGYLKKLDLSHNPIGDSGLGLLVSSLERASPDGSLSVSPCLESLFLGNCSLTARSGETVKRLLGLSGSKGKSQVRMLFLDGNPPLFTGKSVLCVAEGIRECSLTSLSLARNALSEKATAALCQALGVCSSLQSLSLRGSGLNEDGARCIVWDVLKRAGDSLEELFLGGNEMGNGGLMLIAEWLASPLSHQQGGVASASAGAGGGSGDPVVRGCASEGSSGRGLKLLDLSDNSCTARGLCAALEFVVQRGLGADEEGDAEGSPCSASPSSSMPVSASCLRTLSLDHNDLEGSDCERVWSASVDFLCAFPSIRKLSLRSRGGISRERGDAMQASLQCKAGAKSLPWPDIQNRMLL